MCFIITVMSVTKSVPCWREMCFIITVFYNYSIECNKECALLERNVFYNYSIECNEECALSERNVFYNYSVLYLQY